MTMESSNKIHALPKYVGNLLTSSQCSGPSLLIPVTAPAYKQNSIKGNIKGINSQGDSLFLVSA
jgi:hypothetical protein